MLPCPGTCLIQDREDFKEQRERDAAFKLTPSLSLLIASIYNKTLFLMWLLNFTLSSLAELSRVIKKRL